MTKFISCLFMAALTSLFFLLSCKRETFCEGCINGNKPPIAIAGPDQVITLAPKAFHAAIFKNGKIYWAGGASHINYQDCIGNEDILTCEVEIKDGNTQVSSFAHLSYPKFQNKAFEKANKILFLSFYGGWSALRDFDIYDPTSNSWSIGSLPQSISSYASVISVNNTIYVAGGLVNGVLTNQVWKLEF